MITGAEAKLTSSLADVMQKWIDKTCETPEWIEVTGYTGEHVASVMASAALIPLLYSGDTQRYAVREGLLSDG